MSSDGRRFGDRDKHLVFAGLAAIASVALVCAHATGGSQSAQAATPLTSTSVETSSELAQPKSPATPDSISLFGSESQLYSRSIAEANEHEHMVDPPRSTPISIPGAVLQAAGALGLVSGWRMLRWLRASASK